MKHSTRDRQAAKKLRAAGFSYAEISQRLNISKSTVYNWTQQIVLSRKAKERLKKRFSLGVKRGAQFKVQKMEAMKSETRLNAKVAINNLEISGLVLKLLCSFLYWGEGNKSGSYVSFINSDPQMVKVFMELLTKASLTN
jgi:transcriptional regulator with XRE-family HTH domain